MTASLLTSATFAQAFSAVPRQGTIAFPTIVSSTGVSATFQPALADAAANLKLTGTLLCFALEGGASVQQRQERGIHPKRGWIQPLVDADICQFGRWGGGGLIPTPGVWSTLGKDLADAAGLELPPMTTHLCGEMIFRGLHGEVVEVRLDRGGTNFRVTVGRKIADGASYSLAIFVRAIGLVGTEDYYLDFAGRSLAQLQAQVGGSAPPSLAHMATYLADRVVSSGFYNTEEIGEGWDDRTGGQNTVLWARRMFNSGDMMRPVFLVLADDDPQRLDPYTGTTVHGVPEVSLGLHCPPGRAAVVEPFRPLPPLLMAEWDRIAASDRM